MTGPQSQAPPGSPSLLMKENSACLIAEVVGNGTSFDHAIDDALMRLLRQGVKIHGVDVVGWKIAMDTNPEKMTASNLRYRVVLKVAYDGRLQ